jgi:hypothetical protein
MPREHKDAHTQGAIGYGKSEDDRLQEELRGPEENSQVGQGD